MGSECPPHHHRQLDQMHSHPNYVLKWYTLTSPVEMNATSS
uniref:Uncharacterized protein n=1 Tax=Arundo donax TaxID=35708 RepID=A0A0A9EBV6_ARUDO